MVLDGKWLAERFERTIDKHRDSVPIAVTRDCRCVLHYDWYAGSPGSASWYMRLSVNGTVVATIGDRSGVPGKQEKSIDIGPLLDAGPNVIVVDCLTIESDARSRGRVEFRDRGATFIDVEFPTAEIVLQLYERIWYFDAPAV